MNESEFKSDTSDPMLNASFDRMFARLKNRTPAEVLADEERQRVNQMVDAQNNLISVREGWNVPKRHYMTTPDMTGAWGDCLNKLKSLLEPSRGVTMAITGTRGNGKTQLGVELMRWKTKLDQRCKFTTAIELLSVLRGTFRKESDDDEVDVMKAYRTPKLLVIDEFGKHGGSEWDHSMLFELLNKRYNDLTDTLLIDNRDRAEFIKSIGPSLISRMNEGGGIIECGWDSFRK